MFGQSSSYLLLKENNFVMSLKSAEYWYQRRKKCAKLLRRKLVCLDGRNGEEKEQAEYKKRKRKENDEGRTEEVNGPWMEETGKEKNEGWIEDIMTNKYSKYKKTGRNKGRKE